jgi:hypothetical protein
MSSTNSGAVEKAIENFKARSKIVLLHRPIRKMVPSPQWARIISSDGAQAMLAMINVNTVGSA